MFVAHLDVAAAVHAYRLLYLKPNYRLRHRLLLSHRRHQDIPHLVRYLHHQKVVGQLRLMNQ